MVDTAIRTSAAAAVSRTGRCHAKAAVRKAGMARSIATTRLKPRTTKATIAGATAITLGWLARGPIIWEVRKAAVNGLVAAVQNPVPNAAIPSARDVGLVSARGGC